ncbi:2Fe-2S iron-sulfur cluster-binding protein [Altericroceibacterium xinjiangense]|uniref:2Fe-2S iron-sulfur cluster-binding protein n=1 Tax=Altericroceibacterium xinjiangense TaxID=762261 RepID=UPI000F7DE7D3|nr:2Fe-2S iron-sulfur cluster-binding protein [Altericroceibacterium xinjiangense]
MIRLKIENPAGEMREIGVQAEGSLMEAIRDNGFDELLASCGGGCSCGTCHVVIDTASFSQLAAMSADEDSLLDGCDHREKGSRLSCQIRMSDELDGLKLRIPPNS